MAEAMTDAQATALMGPKCPSCGWRGGQHRPGGQWLTPCPKAEEENRG